MMDEFEWMKIEGFFQEWTQEMLASMEELKAQRKELDAGFAGFEEEFRANPNSPLHILTVLELVARSRSVSHQESRFVLEASLSSVRSLESRVKALEERP